jgi:hypothetical protein
MKPEFSKSDSFLFINVSTEFVSCFLFINVGTAFPPSTHEYDPDTISFINIETEYFHLRIIRRSWVLHYLAIFNMNAMHLHSLLSASLKIFFSFRVMAHINYDQNFTAFYLLHSLQTQHVNSVEEHKNIFVLSCLNLYLSFS